ncbi:tRNA pseudouridine(38-40) synthase TruA [Methanorbis rubei]|uniref:tRNA pseudouridine synthase A n=1 Tax=Methanorbis rubei TaxID=3028300 RepID=A0AAE4MDS2_9EURY|nr:tRNA pseudouridine synthase A [Methanocorpusculaceae archaeon Cs1]
MKLAFLLGYKGDEFAGSQFQPNKRTVEGEFVAAGVGLGIFSDAKDAHFRIAGRTDRGVSARRQVASITTDYPEKAVDALNFWLPDDIWCLGSAEVDPNFYPRYAVTNRTYRYYFPYPANISAMNEATEKFVGVHDFTRFSKMEEGRDPNRTVTSASVFAGTDGRPVFEVSAKSFLWNMVRGMAGVLALIGAGIAEPAVVDELLSETGHRVHPAPAKALIFWDAECGVVFQPMRQARETARMLGRASAAARMQAMMTEALMDETPEEMWRLRLAREYPDIRKS